MKVILFGATGMVGAGVLHECLRDDRVSEVLAVQRTATSTKHPKLRELIRADFYNYQDVRDAFRGAEACFFCLGVTAVGKSEQEYHRLTFDLTLAAAKVLAEVNQGMTFCYVSGQGTDSTERGRIMWARVKGKPKTRCWLSRSRRTCFAPVTSSRWAASSRKRESIASSTRS